MYIFDQSLRNLSVHFWSKVLESVFSDFVKSKVYIFDQSLRIIGVHFWSYCRNGVCRADEQSVHFWSKVSFYRCTFLIKDFSQIICKVYILIKVSERSLLDCRSKCTFLIKDPKVFSILIISISFAVLLF